MRQDIDRLMQQQGLAGLVVIAADRYTPPMYYVTGQKLHHAAYFRTADGRAHLVHDVMERDQAAKAHKANSNTSMEHKLRSSAKDRRKQKQELEKTRKEFQHKMEQEQAAEAAEKGAV